MNEYERDSLKQQILYLKNDLNALQEEKNNLTSISSMYQTKALYWQEIAERERKKNKELYSKIELLEGLIDEKIAEIEILKEELKKELSKDGRPNIERFNEKFRVLERLREVLK